MAPLLLIVTLTLLGLLAYLWYLLHQERKHGDTVQRQLAEEMLARASERVTATQDIARLNGDLQRISKWIVVGEAEAVAARIRNEAFVTLQKAQSDAARVAAESEQRAFDLVSGAQREAGDLTSAAREKAAVLKAQAEQTLLDATAQGSEIVAEARRRAEEIAGSAYEALNTADTNRRTAAAMQNIIDGYGNRYIIPTHSLIDDLAEKFSHTDAGKELKRLRERAKWMVRNGAAAACDYVEANRKDTAINFVIDAFNGKADAILTLVKHENVGTLMQEMRDAFTLVNFNGRAFRNARITDEYFSVRLDELKWAAVAHQLKLDEREEQRRIKEQIREEEKARREYERAIRETAREEDVLRKAMEKAQQQIDRATTEQRALYEQQLLELQEKLRLAEERNQRAISMAQQTKRGHVYIISNLGSFGDRVYKIGLTRRLEPLDRICELGDASVPFEFDVHAMIFSEDAPALERQLHKHFLLAQMNKVNHRKEFFRVDLAHIRAEIEKLGVTAQWTMTSAAAEFRETQSIERLIEQDPAMREKWILRQLELDPVTQPSAEDIDDDERFTANRSKAGECETVVAMDG